MISSDAVLDAFSDRYVNAKVNKLIGRAGFTESDRDDLRQSFRLNLLERRRHFDSAKNWEAFVVVVCENFYATVLERQLAEMRSPHREAVSLNQKLPSGSSLADASADDSRRNKPRSDTAQWELSEDTKTVLADMPPMMRKACEILMRDPKRRVESELGMSHGSLYELLDRAVMRFDKAHMRDYL